MKKGNCGLTEQQIKQIKNNSYRVTLERHFYDHIRCGGNMSVKTDCNDNKLILIVTCNDCKKDRTFYFNHH